MEIYPEETEVTVIVGSGVRKRYRRRGVLAIDEVMPHVLMPEQLHALFRSGIQERTREWRQAISHDFGGHRVDMESVRYQTFLTDGLCCARCGATGVKFALERDFGQRDKVKYHLNLYAEDAEGNDVLMTKDHVVPRSLGGSESYTNMRTMCMPCNGARQNCVPCADPSVTERAARIAQRAVEHVWDRAVAHPTPAIAASRTDGVLCLSAGGQVIVDEARGLVVVMGLKGFKAERTTTAWACVDLLADTVGVVLPEGQGRQRAVLVPKENACNVLGACRGLLDALRAMELLPDPVEPPARSHRT